METSVTGKFIDDATQSVWFRNLETPKFKAENTENTVKITTDAVTLVFDKKSEKSKIVTKSGAVIPATNKGNLKGTMRTLDGNFGIYFFKLGIMSKTGVAVFQDKGLILNKDGEVEARKTDTIDKYIFAYGTDYRTALKDFSGLRAACPLSRDMLSATGGADIARIRNRNTSTLCKGSSTKISPSRSRRSIWTGTG